MDLISIIKQLESLGMIGLSLAVACGLAYVLFKREVDGLGQLKSAIDSLARAVDALNTQNASTAAFLQTQAQKAEELAKDVKELKADVGMMKSAMISVGIKSLTKE